MSERDFSDRIAAVRRTRAQTASALERTLHQAEGLSELAICDSWLELMGKHRTIIPDGWYDPPPRGISFLIGQPDDGFDRLNFSSLRKTWARDDVFLRDESVIYAYASPIHRETGLIGDFGVTLYRGSQPSIRDHLSASLEMTMRIARFASVGMELRELFRFADGEIKNARFSNQAASFGSGLANIGHTVPWTYEDYSDDARRRLENGEPSDLHRLIAEQRVFINESATLRIQPTMALTVEPQIKSDTAPTCSFHVIVAFSNGVKTIMSDFGPVFRAFSMGEYLQHLADEPV